jgi:hypothetical protein
MREEKTGDSLFSKHDYQKNPLLFISKNVILKYWVCLA